MTTLDPGILAAIIDRPEDDLLRLIAADWWEEHGESERAEFIRVGCEIAKTSCGCEGDYCTNPTCDWPDDMPALRRRERKLLNYETALVWFGDLYNLLKPGGSVDIVTDQFQGESSNQRLTVHRGFVEVVTLSATAWLRHRNALRAATPLRRLVVSDWDGQNVGPVVCWAGLESRDGRLYDGRVEVVAAGRPTVLFRGLIHQSTIVRPFHEHFTTTS